MINFDQNGFLENFKAVGYHECTSSLPISVYSCYSNLFPEKSIDLGFNDASLQWIGSIPAKISSTINVSSKTGKTFYLELTDVDTIAEVYFNGIEIAKMENMFGSERVDVTQNVQVGINRLNITIGGSVPAALEKSKNWSIIQPPECPTNSQTNGQCHINMLRKAGYSYR